MIEIIISPPLRGGRGRATWLGDELGWSRTPLLSAVRELQRRGVRDSAEIGVRHAGSTVIAMTTTVGAAARLAVEEGDMRFRPYKPFAGTG
jgi:DNA-binding Lrp family transcriptional regulator